MITDEMLATAAKELIWVIGTTFPDPSKNVHHFSHRFRRKMNQLVKKTNHPVRYLWTQRAAGFILVLFVGFMIIFTVSPTVRASVIGWIRERYESYIEYFFNDHLSESPESKEKFDITSLPDGFIESQRVDLDGFCLVVYSNENGNNINFYYSKDPEAGNIMIREEDSTIVTERVNNYEADIYLPNDPSNATSIIWYNTEDNMMFYVSAVCDMDTIIQMAESIKPE